MDDFEGMKNQIHSKIKDKIDENPEKEEDEDALSGSAMNANMADELENESPFHKRLKKRRTAADKIPLSDDGSLCGSGSKTQNVDREIKML